MWHRSDRVAWEVDLNEEHTHDRTRCVAKPLGREGNNWISATQKAG